jgi:hypothetical protein
MWKRNLLFLGLIGGGVFALGASLVPPREPKPATSYDARAYQDQSFRAAVARVDQAFAQEWDYRKVRPAPDAPDLAVARRLALGLLGTIPSLEEIRQFEYLPADERMPWWIDHVLQDQRFADYFAERLARSYVGTEDGPFILYRRRRFVTWLSEQIAKDRPYNQIAFEVITARGLWTDSPATNFLTVTKKPENNTLDPVRLAGRVTRGFLGLRLDCAQCHDHAFKAWKQADFQGLAAFFGQTRVGFTGIYDAHEGEVAIDRKTQAYDVIDNAGMAGDRAVARLAVPKLPGLKEQPPLLDVGTRRQRLAAWVIHPSNTYFSRALVNRVWALMTGRPLCDPVDDLESDQIVAGPLDVLAEDFVSHGYDLRRLIRLIASSRAYRLDSADDTRELTDKDEESWAAFPLTRLRPEQVAGGIIQASSVTTVNADSHFFVRLARITNQRDFLDRYGDTGEDEFSGRGGTIPQRLLLMNGQLTRDRIKEDLFTASSRIAMQAPDDRRAVEAAYLTVLTRRPTPEEAAHFEKLLADRVGAQSRGQKMEDLFWVLINSTEFSWNH